MKKIIPEIHAATIRRTFSFALILAPALLVLYYIQVYGYKVPYWDQWIFPAFLEKAYTGKLTFLDFWAQHNEHRIFFPRLMMLALAYLTHWNITYELYTNFFLAGMTLLFLYSLYKHSMEKPIPSWLAVVFSCIIFSIVQWENWIWGWQIQIFLNVLATVVAVWAIVRWPNSLKGVVIAICASIVASYSFINGLLTWVSVGVLLFAHNHKERRHIALWLSFFVLTIISYYFGYTKPSRHPSPLIFINQIGDYVEYILIFLGASFGFVDMDFMVYEKTSMILASSLVITMFISIFLIWRSKKEDFWRLLPWISLALYAFLSAAATGVGRLGFGVDQALASRYTTISILFVLSSAVTANVSFKYFFNKYKTFKKELVAIVFLVSMPFLLFYVLTFLNAKKQLVERSLSVKGASVCLKNIEIATDDCLKVLFPDTVLFRERSKSLKRMGFIEGSSLNKLKKVKGGLMYIDLVDGQMYALLKNNVLIDVNKNKLLTLTGWAIDDADKNAGKEVYLVLKHKDEETIIPTRREYRPDVAKHFGVDNYSQSGWAFTFKTDNFVPGCYSLSVLILRTGRQEYYELGGSKPICFSKGGTHLR